MRKKKPNKEQRAKLKKQHCDTWTSGFKYGYNMGYEQGKKEAKEGR
ncbi:hypothetical protein RY280_23475 [Bacillus paralicheniformis]|nr:hypothetical protein [Bacillus paralicheniformis]MCM3425599.1 hypothetical protein [Bacillus paralicheniformis]